MADATDKLIAAHLAAALIKHLPIDGLPAKHAANLYYEVLEAVSAEETKRQKPAQASFGKY